MLIKSPARPVGLLHKRIHWLASVSMILCAGISSDLARAQETEGTSPVADINDPGPKPDDVLPAIIANLKRSMKDPYSIRDFALCEPKITKAFKYPGAGNRWEPAHWSVDFELNAKNGFGGYAGRTYFSATYKAGRLDSVGSPNLGADLNTKLLGLTEACPRVPDAEIQRLLSN